MTETGMQATMLATHTATQINSKQQNILHSKAHSKASYIGCAACAAARTSASR